MATVLEKTIRELLVRYPDATYDEKSLTTGGPIRNQNFIGTRDVLFFHSPTSIIHEGPAFLVASKIHMRATEAIHLGLSGASMYLYAPEMVCIFTSHLEVGNIEILVKPKAPVISCKKLTLHKYTKKDPACFETIKGWLVDDDTEITEVVHK